MNEQALEKYLEEMEEFRKRIGEKEDISLELLIKAGICNEQGKLEPEYR